MFSHRQKFFSLWGKAPIFQIPQNQATSLNGPRHTFSGAKLKRYKSGITSTSCNPPMAPSVMLKSFRNLCPRGREKRDYFSVIFVAKCWPANIVSCVTWWTCTREQCLKTFLIDWYIDLYNMGLEPIKLENWALSMQPILYHPKGPFEALDPDCG